LRWFQYCTKQQKQNIKCVFGIGSFYLTVLQKKLVEVSKNAIFLTNQTTSSKLASKKEW